MADHEHHKHAAEGEPFDWNEMYTGEESDFEPANARLLEMVKDLTPGRALDVGCGAGGLVVELAKLGWRVTGIDVAPRAIAAAKKVAAKHGVDVELCVADATRWEPTGSYDLVVSSFALPGKVAGRARLFRAVQGALAPAGHVVIEDFDASMNKHEFLAPYDPLTLDELCEGFDELEIVRAEVVETPMHDHGEPNATSGEPWTAALLHAKKPQ